MLLKFFKGSAPSVIAVIIVLSVLLWLKSFINPTNTTFYFDDYSMPLYALLKTVTRGNLMLEIAISFTFTLISALYLIQINTKHILIKYRTYLPALLYIVLASSFTPLQRLNPAVISSLFIIIAIEYILSTYEKRNSLDSFFRANFFIGIGSLIYLPMALFVIPVFISLIILNSTGIRQWLSAFFGFIAPWFFAFVYYYVWHNSSDMLFAIISESLTPIKTSTFYGVPFSVFYSFIGLLLILSVFFLLGNLPTQKINIRKYYSVLIWLVLFSAVIAFFSPFSSIEIVYIAALPSSFIIANFFTFAKNKFWTELFFWILLIVSASLQFI
jgi:hypothetical protein